MQKPVTLHAHFDGEHIQLDEPCELQPGTPERHRRLLRALSNHLVANLEN